MASKLASLAAKALKASKSLSKPIVSDALGSVTSLAAPPPEPVYVSASTGTPFSTYALFADIVFLLIGVILLVAAQSKCATDANSDACKNHKNWGIAFTVICSIGLVAILYVKYH